MLITAEKCNRNTTVASSGADLYFSRNGKKENLCFPKDTNVFFKTQHHEKCH